MKYLFLSALVVFKRVLLYQLKERIKNFPYFVLLRLYSSLLFRII